MSAITCMSGSRRQCPSRPSPSRLHWCPRHSRLRRLNRLDRRRRQHRLQTLENPVADFGSRQARVQDEIPIRIASRQVEEKGPRARMEAVASRLHPILLPLLTNSQRRIHVENDSEVGSNVVGRPTSDRLHIAQLEHPACALVGQHGIDIPVADDYCASLQSRPDNLSEVLSLICCIQQSFGARGEVAGLGTGHDVTDPPASGGIARLVRPYDSVPPLRQQTTHPCDLRRLTNAIAALENQENTPPHTLFGRRHASSFLFVLVHNARNSSFRRRASSRSRS